MSELAIRGGAPVFPGSFPAWPQAGEEEQKALTSVLESGVWGVGGEVQHGFEKAWATFIGTRHALLTSSGSTALMSILRACGIGAGDEVIIPAYTFQATATSVLLSNAIPIFADVDPDSLCLDADSAAAAITPRTKAIMPVHMAGCPADMDRLSALASRHGLALIEDACQAHGAAYRGRRVGGIGLAGAFSFQSTKNLPAGEGGAVTTSDPGIAAAASAVRHCGISPTGLSAGTWMGGNFRPTEFMAALLLTQLLRLPEQMALRERNASWLDQTLPSIPGIQPLPGTPGTTAHARHLYIFRYNSEAFGGLRRDQFMAALRAEGIPCHGGYQPLYRAAFLNDDLRGTARGWRYFSDQTYEGLSLPATEAACREVVWLTQRLLLGSPDQTRAIVEAVQKIYDHRAELV